MVGGNVGARWREHGARLDGRCGGYRALAKSYVLLSFIELYTDICSGNDILSEQDRDTIRAFVLKIISNMSRTAFQMMRHAFSHKLEISSHYVMLHRVAMLSGIVPEWYDCCIKSCIAYTGDYTELDSCPHCHEARRSAAGKPRRQFCYLPLIPRLQGLFQDVEIIRKLRYRHNFEQKDDVISDVFDTQHYRDLCQTRVEIDGNPEPYNYFSGIDDIALGFASDSYLLFDRRRSGPSATPMLISVFNFPPELRTHLDHLFCVGCIPGPNAPWDQHSFVVPLVVEQVSLAKGIQTYHALFSGNFELRAYIILEMGDIIAIEKLLNIKGHNGYSPCRSCQIKGSRNIAGGDTIYYVPLTQPLDQPLENGKEPGTWDPRDLPYRSHSDFEEITARLKRETVKAQKENLMFNHGLKGLPIFHRVGSLNHASSYPWDLMHLLFENVGPNLVKLWTGTFKGLDQGDGNYEIDAEVWEEIWEETTTSMKTIPSDFIRSLAGGSSKFIAEAWCFWFAYMAPGLLRGRFADPKYHRHACQFSEIIRTCLKFAFTVAEIDELEEKIVDWVLKYEEFVLFPMNST